MRDPMTLEMPTSDGDPQVVAADLGSVDQPASSVVELNLDLPVVEWYLDPDSTMSPWASQSCGGSGCGGDSEGDGGDIEA